MAFDEVSSKDSPWTVNPGSMRQDGALEPFASGCRDVPQMHKSSCSETSERFCVRADMSVCRGRREPVGGTAVRGRGRREATDYRE